MLRVTASRITAESAAMACKSSSMRGSQPLNLPEEPSTAVDHSNRNLESVSVIVEPLCHTAATSKFTNRIATESFAADNSHSEPSYHSIARYYLSKLERKGWRWVVYQWEVGSVGGMLAGSWLLLLLDI